MSAEVIAVYDFAGVGDDSDQTPLANFMRNCGDQWPLAPLMQYGAEAVIVVHEV